MTSQSQERRSRGRAVVVALASAVALFAVAAPTWFAVRVPGILEGEIEVGVSGTGAVPALGGTALVLLAAGGALGIVGSVGRRVVGGLCALAGAVAVWLTVETLSSPAAALRGPVAEATGVGAVSGDISTAPWPYVALGVALVVLLSGAFHALGLGRWPAPGSRHARSAASESPDRSGDPAGADPTRDWDALSEGDDPTLPGQIP